MRRLNSPVEHALSAPTAPPSATTTTDCPNPMLAKTGETYPIDPNTPFTQLIFASTPEVPDSWRRRGHPFRAFPRA